MAEEAERSSKTEAPSQRRLEDARRRGDVPKSPEVGSVATLAAAAAVLAIGGGAFCRGMASALTPFLAHPDAFDITAGGGIGVLHQALAAAVPASIVMVAALAAGVAATFVQQGLLFAPSKLAPDLSKLSLMQGFKRLVGLDNVVNFLKSLTKMALIATATWWVVQPRIGALQGLSALAPVAMLPLIAEMLRALLVAVLGVGGAIAGFDWFWTRSRFTQRMRMTREETRQESKDSDGDPQIKARLRAIRAERSRRRMAQAVPTATVVVMNPTHYAVALRYVQGETAAPLCVAKGVDSLALRIRAIAQEHGVTVVEDPPLARALYATVEVDRAIPREHFEAVAKVIGFILSRGRVSSARSTDRR